MVTASALWANFGPDILLLVFWVFVALFVLSPVLLLNSIYQVRKIGNRYHFRVGYHFKKKQYQNDITVYVVMLALSSGFLVVTVLG